jgi:ubiquinol-cytochrome c reductase cytochrome b subunit
MRLLKSNSLLGLVNSYVIDSPQPANLSYAWNFGSLLATCLGIQIVTGIILAMHYTPNVDLAFVSVEHIMRDVNYGWMIRYIHANVASFFFIFVYLHIGRGLYYGSYKSPRVLPWSIGVIILVLMMGTAFLGYVLPYGQMSLWGATVITNMLSAIPWIGQDFVQFVWGGFSVNNATLNRFFSLHYLLPFLLAALAIMHLMTLHTNGSSNPLGVSSNTDRLPMHPYFIFKDLVTILLFFLALAVIVFYLPNLLGHSDNYIPANPMQTPPSIVPEWYLLPYYAILILLAMPLLDTSRVRGSQFRPLMRFAFWVFVTDFFLLMYLGSQHAEEPYITIGAIATVVYFGWFVVVVPVVGIIENTLMDIATDK